MQCPECKVNNPTSWQQHDTGCGVVKRQRDHEDAAQRLDAERRAHADALPPRPFVHVGEVLGQFYNELTQLIREHQALKAFEARVVEAAKSPAAWLQLRQELAR
jgi:hypothetical protein